jgi:hypothetical protein
MCTGIMPIFMFVDSINEVTVTIPDIEQRINILLIVGSLILILILLLSLKIYQMESDDKGRKKG